MQVARISHDEVTVLGALPPFVELVATVDQIRVYCAPLDAPFDDPLRPLCPPLNHLLLPSVVYIEGDFEYDPASLFRPLHYMEECSANLNDLEVCKSGASEESGDSSSSDGWRSASDLESCGESACSESEASECGSY